MAYILIDECNEVGLNVSSVPPANMTLALPNLIKLYESPIADAPVAHAVHAV